MLCRGSRQLYLTSRAWSQAGNERQEHRWVICPQDSPVLIRARVFRLWMCDLFLLSLNYSLHIMCIAFAHNAPFGPFGLDKLYLSRVSYAHYVTTNAFCVTMQMSARICIIRRMIWLFGTSHYHWLFRRSGFWIFIMGRDKMLISKVLYHQAAGICFWCTAAKLLDFVFKKMFLYICITDRSSDWL